MALANPILATHHKHLRKMKEKNIPKQDDLKDPNPAFQRLKSSWPRKDELDQMIAKLIPWPTNKSNSKNSF